METAANSKLSAIIDLYDMQTGFFRNAIEGISDKDIHNRLETKANHIAWLTGSLIKQRFELARDFGLDQKQQAHDLFERNKGIQDQVTCPSLEIFKNDWERITPVLREALVKASDRDLEKRIEMGPEFSMSVYELITFVSYREANVIGQIALWRRLLGYPAMKYM